MTRLFLDTGRQHGVSPQDVVTAFTTEAGIPPATIGTIEMFGDFTLVEVEREAAAVVLERVTLLLLHGREVHVTQARVKHQREATSPGQPPAVRKPRKETTAPGRPPGAHKRRKKLSGPSRPPGAHKRRKKTTNSGRPAGAREHRR